MTEVNEEIVKIYFENKGYFTRTDIFYWKGKKAGHPSKGSSGRGDIDILGFDPKTKKVIAVEVKGWHQEKMTKSYLKDDNLCRYFGSISLIRDKAKELTGAKDIEIILVIPDYNKDFELAANKKGIKLIKFKDILNELISSIDEKEPYHGETEQVIRLLKKYNFIKS